MKFGISIMNFGIYSDFDGLIALAQDAEEAGWDGIFPWDHIMHIPRQSSVIDPWIALSALSAHTKKIWLGPMVTPLARRRPWKVARESVSLDHLSKGRLILGVGLGSTVNHDFKRFKEETDKKLRAEKLDESLEIYMDCGKGSHSAFLESIIPWKKDQHFCQNPIKRIEFLSGLVGVDGHSIRGHSAGQHDLKVLSLSLLIKREIL